MYCIPPSPLVVQPQPRTVATHRARRPSLEEARHPQAAPARWESPTPRHTNGARFSLPFDEAAALGKAAAPNHPPTAPAGRAAGHLARGTVPRLGRAPIMERHSPRGPPHQGPLHRRRTAIGICPDANGIAAEGNPLTATRVAHCAARAAALAAVCAAARSINHVSLERSTTGGTGVTVAAARHSWAAAWRALAEEGLSRRHSVSSPVSSPLWAAGGGKGRSAPASG